MLGLADDSDVPKEVTVGGRAVELVAGGPVSLLGGSDVDESLVAVDDSLDDTSALSDVVE